MLTESTTLRTGKHGEAGAALIAAIIIIGIVMTIAGAVLLTAVPAYRSTYHASAWQEAKLAADAGVDLAVAEIQKSIQLDTNQYTWPGWTLENGAAVPPKSDQIRILTPPADLLAHSGDGSTRPTVVRVEVDVITRDDNIARNPWYRVRSTGAAEVASSQLGLNKRDVFLRRISTQNQRITRTVEVLVRPVYLWEYALKTAANMTLGGGSSWIIDSYDSRYGFKNAYHRGSAGGTPGNESGPDYGGFYYKNPDPALDVTGAFGNIASNLQRPATSPYGMLIDAEGAMVAGEVHTHGGDNPDTVVFENVEEAQRIDQSRIFSEFDETLLPAEDPLAPRPVEESPKAVIRMVQPWPAGSYETNPSSWSFSSTAGSPGTTLNNPKRILYAPSNKRVTAVPIAAVPADDTVNKHRFVEIYLDGNLSIGSAGIVVPKNVHVKLFVKGDLSYSNRDVNYSTDSNRIPGNLQMFGISQSSTARVDSSGNGHIVAAFYGPQYTGGLDGNTEVIGSFVLKNYSISGGGGSGGDSVGAGFHYDEALGVVGPIQAYKVVSYFEDSRRDVE